MSNPSLKAAEALRRFAQMFDGVPEAIAQLDRTGSMEQACAEAEARLDAARRDSEVQDAKLQASANAAVEAEVRAAKLIEQAEADSAALREKAQAEADALIADAKADCAKVQKDADARRSKAEARADAAEKEAAAALVRRDVALDDLAKAEQSLAELKARLA